MKFRLGNRHYSENRRTYFSVGNLAPHFFNQPFKYLRFYFLWLTAKRTTHKTNVFYIQLSHIDGRNITGKRSNHYPLAHISQMRQTIRNDFAAQTIYGERNRSAFRFKPFQHLYDIFAFRIHNKVRARFSHSFSLAFVYNRSNNVRPERFRHRNHHACKSARAGIHQ